VLLKKLDAASLREELINFCLVLTKEIKGVGVKKPTTASV